MTSGVPELPPLKAVLDYVRETHAVMSGGGRPMISLKDALERAEAMHRSISSIPDPSARREAIKNAFAERRQMLAPLEKEIGKLSDAQARGRVKEYVHGVKVRRKGFEAEVDQRMREAERSAAARKKS